MTKKDKICKNSLEHIDLYAQNAFLSFNGRKRVSSMLGVFSTLLVLSILISYGAYKAVILL